MCVCVRACVSVCLSVCPSVRLFADDQATTLRSSAMQAEIEQAEFQTKVRVTDTSAPTGGECVGMDV